MPVFKPYWEQFGVIVPALVAAILLATASWMATSRIGKTVRMEVGNALQTVLETTRMGIRAWGEEKQVKVSVAARNPRIADLIGELLATPRTADQLLASPAQKELRELLHPLIEIGNEKGFLIVDMEEINIASSHDSMVGIPTQLAKQREVLEAVKRGKPMLSAPLLEEIRLSDAAEKLVAGSASLFVAAPVRDKSDEVIAILAILLEPGGALGPFLRGASIGKTGETYAFDRHGYRIASGRSSYYQPALRSMDSTQTPKLIVEKRTADITLAAGAPMDTSGSGHSFAKMAKRAQTEGLRLDLAGYRNYRNVPVVGAWLWDPVLNLGFATEIEATEAYRNLGVIQRIVWGLTAFAITLLAGLTASFCLSRKRIRASEQRFKDISEAGSDWVWEMGPDLCYTYASEQLCNLLGVTAADIIGTRHGDLPGHQKLAHAGWKAHYEDLEKRRPFRSFQYTYQKPGGRIRTLSISGKPIFDQKGEFCGYRGVGSDVTRHVKARRKLRKAKEMAKAASRTKS